MRLLRLLIRLLPALLTLSTIPLYIAIFTSNRHTSSHHSLYFLKLTLSTVTLTSSLSSATSSIHNPALHVPTWYTVSLYTYCSGGSWGAASLHSYSEEAYDETRPSYCSHPHPAYWLNPATMAGLDTSFLRGDEEYADAMRTYKRSALLLFIAYVTALSASCASAALYLLAAALPCDWRVSYTHNSSSQYVLRISKLITLAAKIALSVQLIFTIGAAAAANALFHALAALVDEKLGRLGVTAIVGTRMLNASSLAGLLSVGAAVSWAVGSYQMPRTGEAIVWPRIVKEPEKWPTLAENESIAFRGRDQKLGLGGKGSEELCALLKEGVDEADLKSWKRLGLLVDEELNTGVGLGLGRGVGGGHTPLRLDTTSSHLHQHADSTKEAAVDASWSSTASTASTTAPIDDFSVRRRSVSHDERSESWHSEIGRSSKSSSLSLSRERERYSVRQSLDTLSQATTVAEREGEEEVVGSLKKEKEGEGQGDDKWAWAWEEDDEAEWREEERIWT